MSQPQSNPKSFQGLQCLKQQAIDIAFQKNARSGKSSESRRTQMVETLAGFHSEGSTTASYSERLRAFTDR